MYMYMFVVIGTCFSHCFLGISILFHSCLQLLSPAGTKQVLCGRYMLRGVAVINYKPIIKQSKVDGGYQLI